MKPTSYLIDLLYLVIYDIHFGHRKNTTAEIIGSLDAMFLRNQDAFKQVKTIFFTGDIFDRLMTLSSQDSLMVMLWFNRLLEFCAEHTIQIRLLEGTPLHDRGQSSVLEMLAANKDVDVKYINSLYIEKNTVLGKTILYLPDEWGESAEAIEEEIISLMTSLSIDEIDIAMMHGLFSYQLPAHIPNLLRLSETFFLKIVKGLIHIGHIHIYNPRGRIIPGGSVDRLAHNEEEDKGIIAVSQINDEYHYEFIVNNDAKTFNTYDITAYETIAALTAYLDNELKLLRKGSHVRLYSKKSNPVLQELSTLKKRYVDIYFTSKVETEKSVLVEPDTTTVSALPTINKNTMVEVFKQYAEKHPMDTPVDRMQSILRKHMDEIKET